MNEWRENVHPRGGDQEHPGRFSEGHGAGGITIRRRALSIWRCIILTSITLPNSITTIGNEAFENWVMLVRK